MQYSLAKCITINITFLSRLITFFMLLMLLGCPQQINIKQMNIMDQSNSKIFIYNGIKIHYTDTGSGDPIILLHGFGGSHYTWRYIIDAFYSKYRMIAIDLKGFGLSEKPARSDYSIAAQSALIQQFILENNLNHVTLVGNSFGGAVALLTAINMQEANQTGLKKLILLDSASFKQSFPFFIELLRIPLLNNLILFVSPNSVSAKMVLTRAFFDDNKITDEMVATYSSYMRMPGAHQALIETSKNIVPRDNESITRKYNQIKLPVLIIWGEHDKIIPNEIGLRLNKSIPNSKFNTILNCGHMPQEECPQDTIQIINDFL